MKPATVSTRRTPGERIAPLSLDTLSHGRVDVPGSDLTHLQFRRFAGCPVCNLHLRAFAREHARIRAAGVRTVAFFHSSAELMRPYQGDLPFAVVPDPERRFYVELGVERATFAVAHPSVVWSAVKGLLLAPSNPLAGNGQTGLPADFLVDDTGALVAVHYGDHANDQWTVDELLAIASRR